MNGFRYLTENLINRIDSKTALYTILISSIAPREDEEPNVYSSYTYDRIESFNLPINDLIDKLIEEGYIEEHADEEGVIWFMLGKWVGKRPAFLLDYIKADISEEIETFKNLVTSAIRSSKKTAGTYRALAEKMSPFLAGNLPSNIPGFVELFTVVSQLFFLEPPRQPLQKEYGQMKTLISLYNSEQLVRMIFYYILNSDKYGGSFPSIGGLLYNKDKISAKLRKTTVKSEDDLTYE